MIEADREFLCFPGPGGVYAVDFEAAEEVCIDVTLRPVPLLPDYICGVFYHKGAMVPVVRMDGKKTEAEGEFSSVLVVWYSKGMLGILVSGSPWVSSFSEAAKTCGDCRELVPELWEVKGAYHENGAIVFLLDIEKSAERLTAYKS